MSLLLLFVTNTRSVLTWEQTPVYLRILLLTQEKPYSRQALAVPPGSRSWSVPGWTRQRGWWVNITSYPILSHLITLYDVISMAPRHHPQPSCCHRTSGDLGGQSWAPCVASPIPCSQQGGCHQLKDVAPFLAPILLQEAVGAARVRGDSVWES